MDTRKIVTPGYSLIEIIVAIAIVGVMATALPRLTRPRYSLQEKLVADMNSIVRTAHAHALITGKPVQIFFDLDHMPRKIMIRVPSTNPTGEKFVPLKSDYGNDELILDEHYEIQQFIIDGKDEALGADLKTVWFYISPDGLAQQVTIVLRDTGSDVARNVKLELNPFFVQFVVA